MSATWESALKRLLELQKELKSEALVIEITNYDDSVERLTLEEVLQRPEGDWKHFKVVNGNDKKELKQFLDWIAPDCID